MGRNLILAVLFSFLCFVSFAANTLDILGTQIPLPEGARLISAAQNGATNLNTALYLSNKPLAEVTQLYKDFFIQNGYIIIGGDENGGFNASVKAEDVMFSIKVYSKDNQTMVQFAW
jgi:hypothetical protein